MTAMLSKLLAEAIGTFAMVFAGCGAIMVAERFPGSLPSAAVPIVFGLVVAAMIYSVGHISGAHFNPAVTLAFALGRHFPARQVVPYWAAQVAGALAASGLLAMLLPSGASFGATVPHVDALRAIGWEIVLTFFLMFVIVSVATDARAVGAMAGQAIGATVAVAAFVGGPVTGASMNPARSLAPALFEGQIAELWIYAVGPIAGAALAVAAYNVIRCPPPTPVARETTKSAQGCC